MLVLSRRADESIEFPNLGITVRVLRLSPKQARIGIEAPPEFAVLRGELGPNSRKAAESRFPVKTAKNLQKHLQDASSLLRDLHQATESTDWETAEPIIFSLFTELKAMDEQVAALSCGAESPVRRSKRALLVDDNMNETKLLASYLRLKKIEVETASDGGDAVDYLNSHSIPDVVVLDMNMPRFDGPWTVRQLRSKPRYKEMKIFAVSGMEPGDCDVDVGPSGIDRWFPKPLNPEDLIHEISVAVNPTAPSTS